MQAAAPFTIYMDRATLEHKLRPVSLNPLVVQDLQHSPPGVWSMSTSATGFARMLRAHPVCNLQSQQSTVFITAHPVCNLIVNVPCDIFLPPRVEGEVITTYCNIPASFIPFDHKLRNGEQLLPDGDHAWCDSAPPARTRRARSVRPGWPGRCHQYYRWKPPRDPIPRCTPVAHMRQRWRPNACRCRGGG